jgi:hypothetical protein
MALSPVDFYAYSRATGAPIPEDAEERARMAPEVYEYRQNQLKRQDEEFNLTNALGVGAALAGVGAGGYALSRTLGRKVPATATSTSRSANEGLVRTNLDRVRTEPTFNRVETEVVKPSKTVDTAQNFTPRQYIENQGSIEPDPWYIKTNRVRSPRTRVERPQAQFLLPGMTELEESLEGSTYNKYFTNKPAGSVAAMATQSAREQIARAEDQLNRTNPESESYISRLRSMRDTKSEQAQDLANNALQALQAGAEQEHYALDTHQEDVLATNSQEALDRAKQGMPAPKPAGISKDWSNKLFNQNGMLREDILSNVIGDTNVLPLYISKALLESSSVNPQGIYNPQAVFAATKHIRENLLTEDYQDTIKNYLITGDIQQLQSRGFGYTTQSPAGTQLLVVSKGEGGEPKFQAKVAAPARYSRSDLEPLFQDKTTGEMVTAQQLAANVAKFNSEAAEAGTGYGAEIGQAVAFVPREPIAPFGSLPGVSASGPIKNKNTGVDYAIGGIKEYGSTPGAADFSGANPLPTYSTTQEYLDAGHIGETKYGKLYAKVKPVSLSTSSYSNRMNMDYGNIFHKNPISGQPWSSEQDVAQFVHNMHSNFNAKVATASERQYGTDLFHEPFLVTLHGTDEKGRTRQTLLDPYEPVGSQGTLASQMQDALLQKGIIQEVHTEEGASYLRQARYDVPTLEGERTPVLGFGDIGKHQQTTGKGTANHYEYLQNVQDLYERQTGNKLADIQVALDLAKTNAGPYLGGPSSNPFLNRALTTANTLTQISEPTRLRMREPGQGESAAERYGVGTRAIAPPSEAERAATAARESRTLSFLEQNPEMMARLYPEKAAGLAAKQQLAKQQGQKVAPANEWADIRNVAASEAQALYEGSKGLSGYEESQIYPEATARPEEPVERRQQTYTPAFEDIAVQGPGLSLTRAEAKAVQRPGGDLSQQIQGRALEQARERGRMARAAALSPGRAVERGAMAIAPGTYLETGLGGLTESEVISRYGRTSSQLAQEANRAMYQAARQQGLPSMPASIRTQVPKPGMNSPTGGVIQPFIPKILETSPKITPGYADELAAYMAKRAPSRMEQNIRQNVAQSKQARLASDFPNAFKASMQKQLRLPIF